jgi:low molecular weight protein-tyrosine phosphatase
MAPVPFTLVFVCTANRARSPVAEAIARRLSPPEVVVRSRGIHTRPGLPPLAEAVSAARRLGFDIDAHRSEQLDRRSVEDADLVVGFEQIHVATAVVDGAAPRERTFTLPELVSLLPGEPPAAGLTATTVVALAAERRTETKVRPESVRDPIGRPQAVVDQIVAEIDVLTRRLVLALFGVV